MVSRRRIVGERLINKAAEAFAADMEGNTAEELNRALLSALRKVYKKTTLRAEWSSSDMIWKER